MEIDLVKLNYVLTIARTRSYSRAAEELRITQPALSRSVMAVEKRFGFKIFDRGRNGVSVTPLGTIVLADAEVLVRDAATFEHNLRLYGRGDAGTVAYGMGPLIASLLLPKLSIAMLAARPQLRMLCSIKPADILLRELLGDNIEMMFCAAEQVSPSPEIVIESLGTIRLAIIARSEHPLTAIDAPKLADLAAYPLASSSELSFLSQLGKGGTLICDNYDIMRELVLGGEAVWMSSPKIVSEDIAAGKLCEIPIIGLPPRQSTVAVVRLKRRTNSPAAKAIATHVRKQLTK